jgi:hypothetical protein
MHLMVADTAVVDGRPTAQGLPVRAAWRQAVAILDQIDRPNAERMRMKLVGQAQ